VAAAVATPLADAAPGPMDAVCDDPAGSKITSRIVGVNKMHGRFHRGNKAETKKHTVNTITKVCWTLARDFSDRAPNQLTRVTLSPSTKGVLS